MTTPLSSAEDPLLHLELEARHRALTPAESKTLASLRASPHRAQVASVLEGLDCVRDARPELPLGFEARLFARLAAEPSAGAQRRRPSSRRSAVLPNSVWSWRNLARFVLGRDDQLHSTPTILVRRMVAVYSGVAIVLLPWILLRGPDTASLGSKRPASAAQAPLHETVCASTPEVDRR